MNEIFLDNNSTTKADSRVIKEMIHCFENNYGNASSSYHIFGWNAKSEIELAREKVAKLIHANNDEIIFTSGATEANNLAINGYFTKNKIKESNIITSNIEHKAVLDVCMKIQSNYPKSIYFTKVNNLGIINLETLKKNINKNTIMVSIMHVNNEIGVIQPIEEIGELCKKNNIIFHVDAAQSAGKIDINVKNMNIDLLSLSSHKMYGPKGIGALYINKNSKRIDLEPLIVGGGQEQNLRAGTLPTELIVGFGKACEINKNEMKKNEKNILHLRTLITDTITNSIPNCIINGTLKNRIAGNINFSFPMLNGMTIINSLHNIAVSNGSACTSSTSKPSHVLLAIGRNRKEALSSIRIGIGKYNTKQEIIKTAQTIIEVIKKKS
ncbi:MAG: IscS subfamily cysteine desulfurase [Candidatus Marinimicrobia bacterium]|nr:IscS subfamily cysteine desulfurase [Candidatus Neomarinimicrobiota bacterium]|tara:strand:+ start:877 stop:2022 length:1146 start_codon:yes stop_codon:yes gene_type:complete